MLMDDDVAKATLMLVAAKVTARAAKRNWEAEKAAAAERGRKEQIGAARAAKHAKIAARPPKTHGVVDQYGRATVF